MGGGRLRLSGGLRSSCSRGGRRSVGGGRSLPRLGAGGSVASVAGAASFSNGAARGDLLTAEGRSESGGASGGGGDHGPADAGADAVVKVRGATAVSVGSAAVGRVVRRRPRSSLRRRAVGRQRRGRQRRGRGGGGRSGRGCGNVGPLGHGTGFGEKYGVLSDATFGIHQISGDIVLDRSHDDPFQQHETESQSHKAHYQGHGTQPGLLARPHGTGAAAERARGSGRRLLGPRLLQCHGRETACARTLTHLAWSFFFFRLVGCLGGQTGGQMIQRHVGGRGRGAEEMPGILKMYSHNTYIYISSCTNIPLLTNALAPTSRHKHS